MSAVRVKFGDIVRKVNDKVDPSVDDIERFVAGEHMDTDEQKIFRFGNVGEGYLGPAFHMRFKPGHILYGSRRTYLRKVAMADFEGVCSNTTFVIAPSDDRLDASYLLNVMSTERFHQNSISLSKGSTNPYINFSDLAAYEFELPSIEEQQRIVELLSGVDAHAEALRNQLHVAKETRKAVLHHLLNARGDDWTETTLGNVAEINSETAKNWGADEIVTYIDLSSVTFDSGVGVELFKGRFKDAPGRARRIVRTGDILVSTVRPYLRGFAVVPSRLDGALASTGFAVLRAKQGASISGFIWALIGTEEFVSHLMELATGSNYPAVRPSDVASTKLLLPPVKEQQRIVDEISKIDNVIQETTSALAATRQLRSALLNKEIS